MNKDMGTTQDRIDSLEGRFLTVKQIIQLLKIVVDAAENNSDIDR